MPGLRALGHDEAKGRRARQSHNRGEQQDSPLVSPLHPLDGMKKRGRIVKSLRRIASPSFLEDAEESLSQPPQLSGAHQGLLESQTQAVLIASLCRHFASKHFGGRVRRGSADARAPRGPVAAGVKFGLESRSQAEVHESNTVVLTDQDIARLDVAVNQAGLVCSCKTTGGVEEPLPGSPDRSALTQASCEGS